MPEVLSEAEKILQSLSEDRITPEEALEKLEVPGEMIGDIKSDFAFDPLRCGFTVVEDNQYIRANQPDLIIVAGRPGSGKTAFASQVALNVSAYSPVHNFSLEMTGKQLKERYISQLTGRGLRQLRYVREDLLKPALETISKHHLKVDDTNGLDINVLMQRAIDFNRRNKLGLIVVDYLQIVTTTKQGLKTDTVGEVAVKLKALAKTLNVPVLALAQMNRGFDYRLTENPEAEPIMADLADSSALEKWADVVLCLHRPYPGLVKVFCLKNRNGPTENFKLKFKGEIMKFEDMGHEVTGL